MNTIDRLRREAERALGEAHNATHNAKEAVETFLRAATNSEPFWGEFENCSEADDFMRKVEELAELASELDDDLTLLHENIDEEAKEELEALEEQRAEDAQHNA